MTGALQTWGEESDARLARKHAREATKAWSAISNKVVTFGMSEAASFGSANALALRAITAAFDEASSAGFRDVSKIACSDIANFLAAVHVSAGTKYAEENQ